MKIKILKPLLLLFFLGGIAYLLTLIDDRYSYRTTIKGTILSSHELIDPPTLYRVSLSFRRRSLIVESDAGRKLEVITGNLECDKVGRLIILDKKVGYLFKTESYENIRCSKETERGTERVTKSNKGGITKGGQTTVK